MNLSNLQMERSIVNYERTSNTDSTGKFCVWARNFTDSIVADIAFYIFIHMYL